MGDVAVVVDDGTLIVPPIPPNLYDLTEGTTIAFVPDGADALAVSTSTGGVMAEAGADLSLGDDDTTEVALGFSFPFLGTTYDSVWVNSDGNITLGAGDSASTDRDAARHIGGPPRMSPLLLDLDPSSGGHVRADVQPDRIVVTWDSVPRFNRSDSNTVQAVLHEDGTVKFGYGAVDSDTGVVGVAEGDDETPFNEIDYTADLPGTFGAGAIFEEFTIGNPNAQLNTLGVAQRFLETHPDQYDFLVIFTDFTVDLGGAFAFHFGVRNETRGLGLSGIFDRTPLLETPQTGPIEELESVLVMNRIGLYWPDARRLVNPPLGQSPVFCIDGEGAGVLPCGALGDRGGQTFRRNRWMGTSQGGGVYTLGLNSPMSVMAQEVGHRWLAFPAFVHPTTGVGPDSGDLLGRGFAHWSFFFDVTVPEQQFGSAPRASSMEGNALVDLGPGAPSPLTGRPLPEPCTAPGESTFVTASGQLVDGYTELDQYFMGLRTAEEVSALRYADEPRSAVTGESLEGLRAALAIESTTFCAKPVELTVADIQAFPFGNHGPRIPALGDENDAADTPDCSSDPMDMKTMAFILLVPGGPSLHTDAIRRVDTFRATWESYANGPATDGRGRFDTSLSPVCH